jgi:hypothetical protein
MNELKAIVLALVLGMSGCGDIDYNDVKCTAITKTKNGCEYHFYDKQYDSHYNLYNCPCDRYKIGDNPFKCK